jgi:hypothetical protein
MTKRVRKPLDPPSFKGHCHRCRNGSLALKLSARLGWLCPECWASRKSQPKPTKE